MAEDLRLTTNEEPTMFNKSMASGAIVGSWIGSFIGSFAGPVGSLGGRAAGAAVGGLWNGSSRKSEMEQELISGKPVKAPTAFNKDALIGFFVGSVISGLVIKGLGAALLAGGAAIAPVAVGALVVAAAIDITATVIGGQRGKAKMETEYRQAIEEKVARETQVSQDRGRGRGIEFDNDVSPNYAAARSQEREHATGQSR